MNDEAHPEAKAIGLETAPPPPLVSINCLTYNHIQYIRQCLDGFLMQKTDFKFEVLVHDDASTDGTADIIREYEAKYPDIIKPIYQTENQYKKGRGLCIGYDLQIKRARGKYIADCEGDDFWTDPLKLQKQVDFLEANPDYGFIGTGFVYLVGDGVEWKEKKGPEGGDYVMMLHKKYSMGTLNAEKSGNIVLYGNVFEYTKKQPACHTASVVYRKSIVEPFSDKIAGDWPLQAVLAHDSKYAFIEDITCMYRTHSESIMNANSLEGNLSRCVWSINNRRMLEELFPGECECGDLNDLIDYEKYLRLKLAIKSFKYKDARRFKANIKTEANKHKKYYRLFKGPISFAILYISSLINL